MKKTAPAPLEPLFIRIRDLYSAEIERLVETFRPRILAGEFSDFDRVGAPRYLKLSEELLQSHPWLRDERSRAIVAASSTWYSSHTRALGDLGDDGFCQEADQCMCHDILGVAAVKGWVRPMRYVNDRQLYSVVKRRRARRAA